MRKRRKRIILYGLIGLIVLFYLTFGRFGFYPLLKVHLKEKSLRQKVQTLQAEKIILEEELKRLKKDKKEIEKLARSKLGMIKGKEKLIVIKEVK